MNAKTVPFIAVLTAGLALRLSYAVSPNADEMAKSREWVTGHFDFRTADASPETFFSFNYDGKPSSELLRTWELKTASRKLDEQRTEYTLTYSDPKTGLIVRCVGMEYLDYPCVEWTLFFKNTSDKDTPILSDIQALDLRLARQSGTGAGVGEFLLHHNAGSRTVPSDYQPLETVLGPGVEKRVGAIGGRSTGGDFSYFNLELSARRGDRDRRRLARPMGRTASFAIRRTICRYGSGRN